MATKKTPIATHKAVGVYIFDDNGRVLLAQRGPKARNEPYTWESPGGSLEANETFEDAAVREVLEELGITDLRLDRVIGDFAATTDANGITWQTRVFAASTNQTPVIKEPEMCVGFGWFTREEAAKLNTASYTTKDFKALGWL